MDEEAMRDRIALILRLSVAFVLYAITDICKELAGLDLKQTKNENVALYYASFFNELAHLSFVYVIIRIYVALMVDRIRIALLQCLDMLIAGSICLLLSLSFLVYLRWFAVVG